VRGTSLEGLAREGAARVEGDQVVFEVAPGWAAPGERRIGYAAIMRLVECVREFHWDRDVLPAAGGQPVDSITRSVLAEFLAPVRVCERVFGSYRVGWCRQRSYGLEVSLSAPGVTALARVDLVNVFYDPAGERAAIPPAALLEALRASQARRAVTPPLAGRST
jgi:acyl-CoA thioesterase FadM